MWLISITEAVIVPVVGALATAAIGGLVWVIRWMRRTTKAAIELPLSSTLADDVRFRFGLRHVRDGTDEATAQGPLLNRDHWFRTDERDSTRLVARLRTTKGLGVQFKCFAEYSDMDLEDAATVLDQEAAIRAVEREDPPRSRRVWLLLSSYRTVSTAEGYTNNFLNPP
jgi:hypothetical protein